MTTKKNAARVAVEAAACANQVSGKPRDVLDCIALGIPREDWECALSNDEAQAWSAWLAQDKRAPMASKPQATPAAPAVTLPTVQQTMHLAVTTVAFWLRNAIGHVMRGTWREEYGDSMSTVELALLSVERLSAGLPMGREDFDSEWLLIGGAVGLAVAAFPDKETADWRCLNAAAQSLTVFAEALELVANQETHRNATKVEG